jgi:hypothetical protein
MAGHSRPKDGVASLAYVPAIHGLLCCREKNVDARHKAGHDRREAGMRFARKRYTNPNSANASL